MAKGSNKTAGQLINENAKKYHGNVDIAEVCEAAQQDYVDKIRNTVEQGIKQFNHDFFVVSEGKVERLLQCTIRNLIKLAVFCPTPHFGQTVYHYDAKKEKLTMLWSIPDKAYAQELRSTIEIKNKAERMLRNDVLDFYEGKLAKKADEYNNQANPMKKIEEIYG